MSAISSIYTSGTKNVKIIKDANINIGNVPCKSFIVKQCFYLLKLIFKMLVIYYTFTLFNSRVIYKPYVNLNVGNISCLYVSIPKLFKIGRANIKCCIFILHP